MGTLPNPDDLRDMLAQVMRLLAEQGLSDKELVLTEWNSAAYRGIDDDTVYKAAYLAKTIVDSLTEPNTAALFLCLKG
ncbi:hypothetical protein ABD76_19555 [Paenibacillus dendritiformis]|uniref:hypothetical protein n=1 Tax=Paenibacillus dendritiformis TaxID=130049 RepID=UPI0018CFA155|nr:hypothetical protein [Paenibacillus dendritiformis]MBG9794564.1 hypothetical protein [Paenibacillus dendritiformis]